MAAICAGVVLLLAGPETAAQPVPTPPPPTAQAPAPDRRDPQAPLARRSVPQFYDLELPLQVNGAYAGDVTARVGVDGAVRVSASRIRTLLQDRISTQAHDRLTALGDRLAALEEFERAGFEIRYDPEALTLSTTLAATDTGLRTLELAAAEPVDPRRVDQPANFAAGLTAIARGGYSHAGPEQGVLPFQADLRGFVTWGGFDGWALAFQADYDDGRERPWRRGAVTLIHDDYDRAVRYQVGDLRPLARGFQTSPDLLGVSVERDYAVLQPFRNIQASGRTTFTLERRARVVIVIDGVPVRTLELEPGPYDVRNLPFAQGANDVRVVVEDDFGQREIASFSAFADLELLAAGLSRFSASAGVVGDRFNSDGEIRYSGDWAVVGNYERGVSDTLTVGVQAELSAAVVMAGAGAAYGTPVGLFVAQGAISGGDNGTGWALVARYRLPPLERGGWTHELDLQAEHVSRRFASVGDFFERETAETRYDFRYTGRRGPVWGSVTASHFDARDRETFLNLTLGTFWRGWNVAASYQPFISDARRERPDRFVLTVSRRLGPLTTARARHVSDPSEYELELQRFSARRVDEWGGRATLNRRSGVTGFDGQLVYTGARGEVELRHLSEGTDLEGLRVSRTELTAGAGFGYAGGRFAMGRPFNDGFVIVGPHASLGDRVVTLREGVNGPVAARSGRLGPGLSPVQRAYQPEVFTAEVQDLPPGYDIGSGRLQVLGGARSGYLYVVGSDAANTLIGVLQGADGQPLALQVGELRSLDRPNTPPVPFFTNSAGRVVVERVAPGRWMLTLADGARSAPVVVPEGTAGLIELGTLTLQEAPR